MRVKDPDTFRAPDTLAPLVVIVPGTERLLKVLKGATSDFEAPVSVIELLPALNAELVPIVQFPAAVMVDPFAFQVALSTVISPITVMDEIPPFQVPVDNVSLAAVIVAEEALKTADGVLTSIKFETVQVPEPALTVGAPPKVVTVRVVTDTEGSDDSASRMRSPAPAGKTDNPARY